MESCISRSQLPAAPTPMAAAAADADMDTYEGTSELMGKHEALTTQELAMMHPIR